MKDQTPSTDPSTGEASSAFLCYPFRDSEEWAGFLISQGLIDESAWFKPWVDDAAGQGRVFESLEVITDHIAATPREIICKKCGLREERGEKPPSDF